MVRFTKIFIAAAVLAFPALANAQVPFTPAKGGYSIVFPEKPAEKELALSDSVKATVYSVNRPDSAFLSGYTEYLGANMDVERELVADVDGFAQQVNATVTDRKRFAIKMPNGELAQKVEFTFEGDKTAGRGILIIPNAHSSVMAAGLTLKPADRRAAVDSFVDSLKISGVQ